MLRFFTLAAGLLLGSVAAAEGGASPALPNPPAVDYAALPETATVRPVNAGGKPHQAVSHLLVDKSVVKAGEVFRIGVHLDPDEHWHTYWKSPGGVGMPTNITWTLPDGTVASSHEYPVPQRFDSSGIISYGYEDQVLLISEVTLPEGTANGPLELKAKADWLVCESTCIPSGDVHLSTTLTVGDESVPGAFTAVFDHYAAHQPAPVLNIKAFAMEPALDTNAVKLWETQKIAVLITPTGDHPLKVPADGSPAFVPIAESENWYIEKSEVYELDDGRMLAIITGQGINEAVPQDDKVGGLWQVQVGDQVLRTEYQTHFPWVGEDATVEPSNSPLFALIPGAEAATPPKGETDEGAQPIEPATLVAPTPEGSGNIAYMLAMAFFGGLLLNIMPCVFPVLTLKLFGLVNHADATPAEQRRAGLAYTAGILVSFWALAAAVLAAKAATMSVGWGMQFQSPIYVAVLATIVFAFGLSMFGVFEVPAFGAEAAGNASSKHSGVAGDFANGVFATLLATPCTAPFLGPAVGFAFAQSGVVIVLFFTVIALGLASPFLLIAFMPWLFERMPAPGAWMDTFKQFMGFTLIATTIWMVDILGAQIGREGAVGFLAFLGFVAFGCWIFGHWGGLAETRQRQATAFGAALVATALGGYLFLDLSMAEAVGECDDGSVSAELDFAEEIPWQAFNAERLAALDGQPIFVDFTADWCLTCKVNENTILETELIRDAMVEHGIVPLKADWTRRDDYITEWLARFGRAGVPFYLVIPADGSEPIALPEVITSDSVITAMKQGAGV